MLDGWSSRTVCGGRIKMKMRFEKFECQKRYQVYQPTNLANNWRAANTRQLLFQLLRSRAGEGVGIFMSLLARAKHSTLGLIAEACDFCPKGE